MNTENLLWHCITAVCMIVGGVAAGLLLGGAVHGPGLNFLVGIVAGFGLSQGVLRVVRGP